jgi:hypothetical protein
VGNFAMQCFLLRCKEAMQAPLVDLQEMLRVHEIVKGACRSDEHYNITVLEYAETICM